MSRDVLAALDALDRRPGVRVVPRTAPPTRRDDRRPAGPGGPMPAPLSAAAWTASMRRWVAAGGSCE